MGSTLWGALPQNPFSTYLFIFLAKKKQKAEQRPKKACPNPTTM
jgi:hypothetical protein